MCVSVSSSSGGISMCFGWCSCGCAPLCDNALKQKVFFAFRMCSHTECVLLYNVFYHRMCFHAGSHVVWSSLRQCVVIEGACFQKSSPNVKWLYISECERQLTFENVWQGVCVCWSAFMQFTGIICENACSKVLSLVTVYSKCMKAITFENFRRSHKWHDLLSLPGAHSKKSSLQWLCIVQYSTCPKALTFENVCQDHSPTRERLEAQILESVFFSAFTQCIWWSADVWECMSVGVTLHHRDHHMLHALDLFNKVGDGISGDGARRLCWLLG